MPMRLFLTAACLLFAALASTGLYYALRARRASCDTWKNLISRLRPVPRENVQHVALDLLEGNPGEAPLDPERIWELLGGMAGLDAMEQNCDVLIDLAAFVARSYPEAQQIADDLRLNAREIQWHVSRLRGAERTGHQREQFSTYAQPAVATYYLMTRSILLLYEGARVPGFADLQAAL